MIDGPVVKMLRVDADLVRQLRIEAATRDITLRALVEEVLLFYVEVGWVREKWDKVQPAPTGDPDLINELRVLAAERRVTLRALVELVLWEYIRADSGVA